MNERLSSSIKPPRPTSQQANNGHKVASAMAEQKQKLESFENRALVHIRLDPYFQLRRSSQLEVGVQNRKYVSTAAEKKRAKK
jgi:hypothetical protein